jgi:hypothetical protein
VLYESLSVELLASDETGHRLQAILLNLGGHGLACKVNDAETWWLRAGTIVRAVFRIDGDGPQMDIAARVINLTPACDAHCIVGVEFLADEERTGRSRSRAQ